MVTVDGTQKDGSEWHRKNAPPPRIDILQPLSNVTLDRAEQRLKQDSEIA
jgi:hypothetical protein